MRFQTTKLISTSWGLLAGTLMCAGVAAQVITTPVPPMPGPTIPGPPIVTVAYPLTDVTFSSPFINIGGSPQNIFVTPVPATASLGNCTITSPTTALATYNPTYILGPTITASPTATGTTQAVVHTFTCGSVSKTFVVKPPTYPADIVLSGTELQVGSTTPQSLTVTASPAGTVLPTCTISSTPALSTVTVDATLGTGIALTPSADAITADTSQTVTCGSLSKSFTVKAKNVAKFSIVADGPITDQSIVASVTVAPADQGKRGFVFVLLLFDFKPVVLAGDPFQLVVLPVSAAGSFPVGDVPPPFFDGVLNSHTLRLPKGNYGLFKGNLLSIGYGVGTDRGAAFANMMANANVCYCHTFK